MRKLFSDDEAKAIAKEYEGGATLQVLANKHRTDRSTISRSIVRSGGTIRSQKESQKTTFSPEVCADIRKDYEAGGTLWTLAKKYNCAHTTIRLSVIRAGGKMRSKGETVPGKKKRPYRIKRGGKRTRGLLGWLDS